MFDFSGISVAEGNGVLLLAMVGYALLELAFGQFFEFPQHLNLLEYLVIL